MDRTRVRLTVDHFVFFQRVDADAVLGRRSEIARGEQVRVRPHSVLRIIGEVEDAVERGLERIAVVRAGRIARRRDRDAIPERFGRVEEAARCELT